MSKDQDPDVLFDEMIQDALSRAAAIPCSVDTYRKNLRYWVEVIENAVTASEEMDGSDDD